MRRQQIIFLIAVLVVLSSCGSRRTGAYYVREMRVDRDQHLLPVGAGSMFEPTSGSYYFFFYAATVITSVSHMERNGSSVQHRTLYLETNRQDQLDRTVKSDVLLTGDFGMAYAQKTCFYNRPVESNYSSVSVRFDSDEYPSAFEVPSVLSGTPDNVPPLSSVSLVRVLRKESGYTLVSADYESTGELRGFQVAEAKNGNISPATDVQTVSPPDRSGSTDPRLVRYGIPPRIDVQKYLSVHRLPLPSGPAALEESTSLIQFYGYGKLMQQQQLRSGVPVSTRWLQPSTTEEEHTIGPECDSRFAQQRSMGLPTTGY
jgi:hypothetical protein